MNTVGPQGNLRPGSIANLKTLTRTIPNPDHFSFPVAVTGSPVITDLPIADRIKLIYKNRFLIVEASNAEEISFFNIKPGNSAILLRNSTKESGFLGPIVDFRSDIDKQAEGFVVETRPGEKGVSPDEFCMLKSECFQNLKFLCEGPIALRSLNAEEKEQIERLKMKHANDRKFASGWLLIEVVS